MARAPRKTEAVTQPSLEDALRAAPEADAPIPEFRADDGEDVTPEAAKPAVPTVEAKPAEPAPTLWSGIRRVDY